MPDTSDPCGHVTPTSMPATVATAAADATSPVGIVSGTGATGRALAARLASVGSDVLLGSRELDRADAARADVAQKLRDRQGTGAVRAVSNDTAARAAMVVVATNANHTVSAVAALAGELAGSVVVCMASRLAVGIRGMRPSPPAAGSVALALAAALPASQVVATLHHVSAAVLGDLRFALEADLLVCGDDGAAVGAVMARLAPMTGGNVHDAGGLASAVALESMTAVLVTLNRSSGGRFGIDLVDQRAHARAHDEPDTFGPDLSIRNPRSPTDPTKAGT